MTNDEFADRIVGELQKQVDASDDELATIRPMTDGVMVYLQFLHAGIDTTVELSPQMAIDHAESILRLAEQCQ